MIKIRTKKQLITEILICAGVLGVVVFVCMLAGTEDVSFLKALDGPGDRAGDNIDYEIMFGIRLPRLILAAIVGAALACSGVVLQGILRNPLADPYILGISSGAGLGAIIAVLSGFSWTFWAGSPVSLCAFTGATGTVWLVWWIGRLAGKHDMTSLLLAGVVVNAFFSAIMMFLITVSKESELYLTVYWLMGNLREQSGAVLLVSGFFAVAAIFVLFMISCRLNALSLGDDQARSLGVNPSMTRLVGFGVSAFITAVAVSLSGLIGFVGLIVPHGVRLISGPDHRHVLPLSAVTGAVFLVVADTAARVIVRPGQLPVGVITAMAGGPFFLILLAGYGRKIGRLK
jgi:iron complex transport system permease protein